MARTRKEPPKTSAWSGRPRTTRTWPLPGFLPIQVNPELEAAMKNFRNGKG